MWIYIISACLLFILELAYFKVANRLNIIDKPNERSSHNNITLRGGGIIFYFSVLLYFFVFRFQYPWFLLGLTVIATISFADDIKPQSFLLRLVLQFIAIGLMFYQLGLFEMHWYFILISLIFCIGILNAYNFMDGINGMTGGYSMVVIGALWYINNHQTYFVDNNLLYILLIALLVFNFFNFRSKAKCFAGDVGALSFAFVAVFLIGLLIIKTNNFSYILLLSLYGIDTILTVVHRLMLKENIFMSHREHLFQIMANELKLPHLVVSLIYMSLQTLINLGLIIASYRYLYSVVVIFSLSLIYVIAIVKFFNLHVPQSNSSQNIKIKF